MTPRLHPAERYARDVIDNKIPACHWVKQACKRYFNDKKNAKHNGLYFDREAAQLAIDFFSMLNHVEGEFVGMPFELLPWEQFIIWNLFGWMRDKHPRWIIKLPTGITEDTSGTRRFRVAYIEVAKKNGKTALAAGIGLKLAFADHESSAEVYSLATKRDQAKICWRHAKKFVEVSDFLTDDLGIEPLANNLSQPNSFSKFETFSSDYNTADGPNIFGAICDELHQWPNRNLFDKINQGTGARRQPLIVMITTAGEDQYSFCYSQRDYTCKVLDNILSNDEWFGVVYTLDGYDNPDDKPDDPFDIDNWQKANPGLGENKKIADMQKLANTAKEIPTEKNAFLRYQVNIWVRGETKWMPMDKWRLNTGPVPALQMEAFLAARADRTCYAGLDLASVSDLTALVLEFPPVENDPLHYVLPFFFVPEDGILNRARNDRVPYDVWADQGYLIATPGNITDQNFIMSKIDSLMQKFNLRRLYFDRHGSTKIVTDLQNELNFTVDVKDHEDNGRPLLVQFGQGWVSMSPPMKDLLRVVLLHQYAHGDHPVLTWNMDNLIAKVSNTVSISPDKQKSREKIDGAVALIMAHAGNMVHTPPEDNRSVYEDRGLLVI